MEHEGWGVRVYPYLIALSFPLCMLLSNLSEDPGVIDVGATFGLALLFVALCDRILRRPLRDPVTRSLWLVLAVVGFFGYGHAFSLLKACIPIQQRYFAPLWLVLFGSAGAGLLLARRSRLIALASRLARNTSYLLLGVQFVWAVPVVWAQFSGVGSSLPPPEPGSPAADVSGSDQRLLRPDIYYIILDGYARADVLKEFYGYDNREFLDKLESRGFYIARRARSNYSQTRLSLASSLSMEYLPSVPAGTSYDAMHREIRRLRKDSRVVERLRELGYRYRYVGSMYFPVDAAADEELSPDGAGRTYLRAFLETSAALSVERVLHIGGYLQDPVAINEFQFRNIAAANSSPAPLYTFAHIACPHEPYIYDRRGPLPHPIPPDEATPDDYLAQLEYLNARVLELVDAIQRASGPDAIVLLQADHGSALEGMPTRSDARGLTERMSIFSAYRCPDQVRRRLYPTITPVNSFRALFTGLFGDDLPLLEDRSFYSSYEGPFDFVEVPPQGPSPHTVPGPDGPAAALAAGQGPTPSERR